MISLSAGTTTITPVIFRDILCHHPQPASEPATYQVSQRREVHGDGEKAAEESEASKASRHVGDQQVEVAVAEQKQRQQRYGLEQYGTLGGGEGRGNRKGRLEAMHL